MAFILPPDLQRTDDAPPVARSIAQPSRDHRGRLLPGHTANPKGKATGDWKKYPARARQLLSQYTIGDIKKLIATGQIDEMPAWDALILRHILEAATKGDIHLSQLIDRVDGMPPITDNVARQPEITG